VRQRDTNAHLRAVLCASLAIASACVASPGADGSIAEESGATQYVNIMDFAKTDQGAWYDLERKLAGELASVCGDTFCEGDFANLQPLTFSCSVTSKTGSVKDCAWTFAGSYAFTDPKTAAIRVDAPAFVCHVAPKTTSVKLIALLQSSADAIHETLPGTTGSLYDALVDCFQHPIGGTPFTPPSTSGTPGTYVDADQYYASAANQTRWRAGVAALTRAFDDICGDTFCGGDFGDLRALQLQCAITRSSGNVKSCAWIFGGSVTTIATTGAVTPTARTWTCPVAMHGTIAQLTTTLTAPDVIHHTLPGMTTSAYDAISSCLP